MIRLQHLIDELNMEIFNLVGLNILWPRNVAFHYVNPVLPCRFRISTYPLFPQLEIEYYVSDPHPNSKCSLTFMYEQ